MPFALMRPALIFCTALWTLVGGSVAAQERAIVVELFTSQGCNSCPPADALLRELADRDDILPLALHVDYWDYLGWRDRFAQPGFSKRQKGYARRAGRRTVYTPELVVQGSDTVMGARGMKLSELVRRHAGQEALVGLSIARDGTEVVIEATALVALPKVDIHVVHYTDSETVEIRRGENAGRSITYSHIAKDWHTAGTWTDGDSWAGRAPAMDMPLVVMVQETGYGPILAAARLR